MKSWPKHQAKLLRTLLMAKATTKLAPRDNPFSCQILPLEERNLRIPASLRC